MIAPTFITAFVMLVGGLLANHGIPISTNDLTVTVQTLILIGGPIVVMFCQWWTGRSTLFGTRPGNQTQG